MDLQHGSLLAFTAAAILLNLSPGPSLLFVSAFGMKQGKKAGILSALGLATGSALHALLAGVGMTAIISKSETLTIIIGIIGGVYVCFIGLKNLEFRTRTIQKNTYPSKVESSYKIYVQSILVEFLNPKTILFYLAVLPSFITIGNYSFLESIAISLIIPVTALPIDIFAGLTSGYFSKKTSISSLYINNLSGIILFFVGLYLIYNSNILNIF